MAKKIVYGDDGKIVKPFNKEEKKILQDYLDKEYKSFIIERLKKENYTDKKIKKFLKEKLKSAEWCSICGHEQKYKMNYYNFQPIICPTCGNYLSICSFCSDLMGDYCVKRCPLAVIQEYREKQEQYNMEMKKLKEELEDVLKQIKTFVPDIEDELLCDLFDNSVNKTYHEKNGNKFVEIHCQSYKPSEVWKKVNPVSYILEKQNFANRLPEKQKNYFTDYIHLVARKNRINRSIDEILDKKTGENNG